LEATRRWGNPEFLHIKSHIVTRLFNIAHFLLAVISSQTAVTGVTALSGNKAGRKISGGT
jgi:hypothetical protein